MSQAWSIEQIQRYIPHRYPFLLVDKVLSFEQDAITALKNITINEPFFNGHFPVKPVMPGVLMVEALAQTAGLLMAHILQWPEHHSNICYLAGVDQARFKRIVEPGDALTLNVKVEVQRQLIWKFSAAATVDGVLACSCQIVLAKEK